jgi:hypothetical protein
MRQVIVTWRDSRMYVSQQMSAEDIGGVCVIRSVGWLLAKSKDRVVIARDHHDGDQWRGVLVIPREAVMKITRGRRR